MNGTYTNGDLMLKLAHISVDEFSKLDPETKGFPTVFAVWPAINDYEYAVSITMTRIKEPGSAAAEQDEVLKDTKRCPFCGGVETYMVDSNCPMYASGRAYAVSCGAHGCHGGVYALVGDMFKTPAQAKAAWNRRA